MKIKLLLAGLLLVASATSAMAAGPYVGVGVGVSMIHDSDVDLPGGPTLTVEYDTGYGINGSVGYNFDPVRLEFELGFKSADIDTIESISVTGGDATFMSYMANGYYDIKTQSAVTPYIGAGIGLINGELNDNGDKDDDTVLGYQLIAGLGFKVDKNITLDLSYRFQGAAEDLNIWGADVTYMSSSLMAGVRINF